MAKHTDEGPTNPEVRFERADIEPGKVVNFSVILGVILVVVSVLVTWLAWHVTSEENRIKATTLPPAKVDADRLPPQPRLEALDDLRKPQNPIELYPPRARSFLEKQKQELKDGNLSENIEPIDKAMAQLAGRLPARKQAPPAGFGVALPSKAASGRVETGGQ
jgi:hypothetical protein